MTWTYKKTDAGNLSVYDHTDAHITTVMNDGSGVRTPNDVLDVMADELDAAIAAGEISRAVKIVGDAACEQIEERSP